MEVNRTRNHLVTNILQNEFFCVPQKKVVQVCNDLRDSKWGQSFHFWWTMPCTYVLIFWLLSERFLKVHSVNFHMLCWLKQQSSWNLVFLAVWIQHQANSVVSHYQYQCRIVLFIVRHNYFIQWVKESNKRGYWDKISFFVCLLILSHSSGSHHVIHSMAFHLCVCIRRKTLLRLQQSTSMCSLDQTWIWRILGL